ncbi:MAG TPA: glycoside hydrolase, partial [Leeuwenhoekiella sp.]|nr:glycoside hydrolase [Leeuwenhoekiella sp.]
MIHRIVIIGWLLLSSVLLGCKDKNESRSHEQLETLQPIEIADNAHFFKRANGDPFFWLGDTAWLLLKKLDREAISAYFDDRKKKGFNVIQVMVLHTLDVENVYGSKALIEDQINTPNVIAG